MGFFSTRPRSQIGCTVVSRDKKTRPWQTHSTFPVFLITIIVLSVLKYGSILSTVELWCVDAGNAISAGSDINYVRTKRIGNARTKRSQTQALLKTG